MATVTILVAAGAEVVAPPVETPWRSLNSRLDAPAGLHITLVQALEMWQFQQVGWCGGAVVRLVR